MPVGLCRLLQLVSLSCYVGKAAYVLRPWSPCLGLGNGRAARSDLIRKPTRAVLCLAAIPIWWARASQVDWQLRAECSLCHLQRREAWGLPLKAQPRLPRERTVFPQQPESLLLLAHRVPLGLPRARPSWILLSQLLGCQRGESLPLLYYYFQTPNGWPIFHTSIRRNIFTASEENLQSDFETAENFLRG